MASVLYLWVVVRLVRGGGYWNLVAPGGYRVPETSVRDGFVKIYLRLPWCSKPLPLYARPHNVRGKVWLALQKALDPLMEYLRSKGVNYLEAALPYEAEEASIEEPVSQ